MVPDSFKENPSGQAALPTAEENAVSSDWCLHVSLTAGFTFN